MAIHDYDDRLDEQQMDNYDFYADEFGERIGNQDSEMEDSESEEDSILADETTMNDTATTDSFENDFHESLTQSEDQLDDPDLSAEAEYDSDNQESQPNQNEQEKS
jgi:hypothetical protein